MVEGKFRSRTYRRVHKTTPGGRNVLHHALRKPKIAHCAVCGAKLKGVPRERPYKMQNMPKTKKRPERPFGGFLCSKCSRNKIMEEARR
ncbi:MAG: 50S ribosomal protein L34e [Candidatus Woesearchaeota archaeon]